MEKELNMKTINNYILSKIKNETNITEKLKISKNKQVEYILFPKDIDELNEMISEEIYKNGKNCSLNHIDTSKITNMNNLFYRSKIAMFNGNISEWDVSNVTDMHEMFWKSEFNGDLSKWDVSNVENMCGMFDKSNFNNNSICFWDVVKVQTMYEMFYNSNFNQDISKWKINPNCNTDYMFYECIIEDKYKPYKNGKRI